MNCKPALLFLSLVISLALIGCTGLPGNQNTLQTPAPSTTGSTPHSTFVYVANNGSGTIAKFKMADDGSLTFIDLTSARGVHWLAAIGNRFIVASEDKGDPGPGQLEAFKIDSTTGALSSFSVVPFKGAANSMTAEEAASMVYFGTNDAIYGYSVTAAGLTALPGSPYRANSPDQDPRSDTSAEAVLVTPFSPYLYAAYAGYRDSGYMAVIQRDPNGALTTGKIAGFDQTFSVAAFANGKFAYTTFGADGYRVDSSGQPTAIFGATAPNADIIANDPSGKFLFGIVRGGNGISVSSIDSDTGMPTEVAGSPFSTQGDGASWVRTDPQGRFVFVTNGSNYVSDSPPNTVAVFSLNNSTGVITPVPGSPFPSQGTFPTDVVVVH